MAGVLLAATGLIVAYWVEWLTRRSLVASETGVAYTQFEDAFPLADGWLALCLAAAAFCLQHGVWGRGGNGLVELAINALTLGLSLFVLRWTWLRREALLSP